MLRGCRLVFHSEHVDAGIDSTRRRSVPRPTAIALVRCRAQCYASRAKRQCRGHAVLAGLPVHHNRGRPARNQADSVDVPALPATLGWNQRALALAGSRYDLHQ
jgi:hypothetical protein